MDTTIHDDVLGKLTWSEEGPAWQGMLAFLDLPMPLVIEFDLHEPSEEERQQAVRLAREQFVKLDAEWEARSRQVAANELMEAVYQQAEEDPTDDEISVLIDDMVLRGLDFIFMSDEQVAVPYLSYNAPTCFPEMHINLQFRDDLSIDEVMLEE